MGNELIRPIDAETAAAIAETAKTLSKGMDLTKGIGEYVAEMMGSAPRNFVGLVAGDWLFHARIRRWAKLRARTQEIMLEYGMTSALEDISPSVAIPLLEAAVDEERPELFDIWCKLLVAAADPDKQSLVRRDIIDVIKRFEPADARLLEAFREAANKDLPKTMRINTAVHNLVGSSDENEIAMYSLIRHGVFVDVSVNSTRHVTALGRLILRLTAPPAS